ncbi:lycopene cyclase family protein [Stutzerimonas kunmingensis]|uniref:lycopene cyclase family protein n=1 Tax=Stutzerimonas kunmingensis TaxID=1211807 RepID=UPI00241FA3EA|nr:lycopene cyclase family protein [Stutzerimonas kunmingensis]
MPRYDLILVGAGLANGLIALRLRQQRPSMRILLIDAEREPGANHTWSFHAEDLTETQHRWIAPLVVHHWPEYEVRFPQRSRSLNSGYFCVTAERFAQVIRDRFAPDLLLNTRVAGIASRAVTLDDGRVLIDSNAILDHFDQQAGAERALLPLSGPQRSEAMNLLAFAVGACEKTVAAYYERDRRPEGLVWDDWYRHCEDQARGALALLDAHQAERGERPLLGERMSQVDISAVVAYDFARITLPDTLAPDGTFPHLASASQRANALPAFAQTQWKG